MLLHAMMKKVLNAAAEVQGKRLFSSLFGLMMMKQVAFVFLNRELVKLRELGFKYWNLAKRCSESIKSEPEVDLV